MNTLFTCQIVFKIFLNKWTKITWEEDRAINFNLIDHNHYHYTKKYNKIHLFFYSTIFLSVLYYTQYIDSICGE